MLAFPCSAGLSEVAVAEPQPLFVTLASVSLKAELVKPHWPLAAAVNSAICAALADPAVTGKLRARPATGWGWLRATSRPGWPWWRLASAWPCDPPRLTM